MKTTIDKLYESVRLQIQDLEIWDDLSDKLSRKKYREAFRIFYDLKKSGKWILDNGDEENLEKFWWDYAN